MPEQPFTGTVEVTICCVCGIYFGVPRRYLQERRDDGKKYYCPNGHSLGYGNSWKDQQTRETDRANAIARKAVKDKREAIKIAKEAVKATEEAQRLLNVTERAADGKAALSSSPQNDNIEAWRNRIPDESAP